MALPEYSCLAKSMAICLPIPLEAPITRATGFDIDMVMKGVDDVAPA